MLEHPSISMDLVQDKMHIDGSRRTIIKRHTMNDCELKAKFERVEWIVRRCRESIANANTQQAKNDAWDNLYVMILEYVDECIEAKD